MSGLHSPGGAYDAASFTAGWEAGALDLLLSITSTYGAGVERWVPPELVPRLDLIAMRHGYQLTAEPWDEHPDEYVHVIFSLPDPTPPPETHDGL